MRTLEQRLDRFGDAVLLAADEHSGDVALSAGDPDATFFAASVSKLFTHALAFAAIDDGVLSYGDLVTELLPRADVDGIHVLHGRDHGPDITVRHLIDQTSGLANPELEKAGRRPPLVEEIRRRDRAVPWDELAERHRHMGGKHVPGTRAHYSDSNALLLARVLEAVSGRNFEDGLQERITGPLSLNGTGVIDPQRPPDLPVRSRQGTLSIAHYAASQPAAGGIATNARDLLRFSRAFHGGELFDAGHVRAPQFRRIQFVPLRYGAGMMRLALPRFLSPMIPAPEILGHSGSTGSFAFRCPARGLHVVGTINHIDVKPFEIIYRAINHVG